MSKAKPFDIPKALVWKAFHLVKANKGSAGVDRESINDFEHNYLETYINFGIDYLPGHIFHQQLEE